jgi:heat shock protein HtpX
VERNTVKIHCQPVLAVANRRINCVYSEIAKNNRRSIVIIVFFFLIWIGIGALAGYAFTTFASHTGYDQYGNYQNVQYGAKPIFIGMIIALILAILGLMFSMTSGAALVLRVSGAQPADPVVYQKLHDTVEALATGDGLKKPDVYIIHDDSPNAFATGISRDKAAITFTTGLLAMMNQEELEGVTSHEMSHIKNHDVRLLVIVSTLVGLAALLASVMWRGAFFANMGRSRNGGAIVIVIIALGALLAVVGFLLGPLIRLALSRRRESLADASGVELTRNPEGLLSALKKLANNDVPFKGMTHATAAMCIDDPLQHHETWFHRLYDTHPPIEERIAALEKILSGGSV